MLVGEFMPRSNRGRRDDGSTKPTSNENTYAWRAAAEDETC